MPSSDVDIVFNPSTSDNENGPLRRWKGFVSACAEGNGLVWTGKKSAKPGDLYLFWFGDPKQFIGGIGIHDGTVEGKTRWRSPQIGFDPAIRLTAPIHLADIHADRVLDVWWSGNPYWGGPKTIAKQPVVAQRLLELIVERNPHLAKLLNPYVESTSFRPNQVSSSSAKRLASNISRLSTEEQERVYRAVLRAVRDRTLRPRVLALWGNACAACGAALSSKNEGPWECEVAHIKEVKAQGVDEIDNAFPVCRTHHWAFDQNLWTIEPKTMKVVVAQVHRKASILAKLHGRPLVSNGPRGPSLLNKKFLRERYEALLK